MAGFRALDLGLELIRGLRQPVATIRRRSERLAFQIEAAASSIVLNLGEGNGSSGGTRRARYESARGSARETLYGLEAAAAVGYAPALSNAQRNRFDWILGVLVKLS